MQAMMCWRWKTEDTGLKRRNAGMNGFPDVTGFQTGFAVMIQTRPMPTTSWPAEQGMVNARGADEVTRGNREPMKSSLT